MPKNLKKSLQKWTSLFLFALLLLSACEVDHKGLINRTLDARETAFNERNLELYLSLISKDYVYKPTSKLSIEEYMKEYLLIWDVVHFNTYNRLIYTSGGYARVSQDFQLSVQKNGKKPVVMSGAEHFELKKEGWLSPKWKFFKGLDQM